MTAQGTQGIRLVLPSSDPSIFTLAVLEIDIVKTVCNIMLIPMA